MTTPERRMIKTTISREYFFVISFAVKSLVTAKNVAISITRAPLKNDVVAETETFWLSKIAIPIIPPIIAIIRIGCIVFLKNINSIIIAIIGALFKIRKALTIGISVIALKISMLVPPARKTKMIICFVKRI